jgi:hypothetical protein
LWWKGDLYICSYMGWFSVPLKGVQNYVSSQFYFRNCWNSLERVLHSDYFPATIMVFFCHVLFQMYFHICFFFLHISRGRKIMCT